MALCRLVSTNLGQERAVNQPVDDGHRGCYQDCRGCRSDNIARQVSPKTTAGRLPLIQDWLFLLHTQGLKNDIRWSRTDQDSSCLDVVSMSRVCSNYLPASRPLRLAWK